MPHVVVSAASARQATARQAIQPKLAAVQYAAIMLGSHRYGTSNARPARHVTEAMSPCSRTLTKHLRKVRT